MKSYGLASVLSFVLSFVCLLCAGTSALGAPTPMVVEWAMRHSVSPTYSFTATEMGKSLAIDPLGNIVIAGICYQDANKNTDILVVKYDCDGGLLWSRQFDGGGNGQDEALAVATDAAGNVFVGGNTSLGGVTLKYDPSGALLWSRNYAGVVSAMKADAGGNAIVTGSIGLGTDNVNWGTVKYDPDGAVLWERVLDGPNPGADTSVAMAIDVEGNIVVTGSSFTDSASSLDLTTVKYDADGNKVWENRYNGPSSSWDEGKALAIDSAGNVYVAGNVSNADGYSDYVTIKYTADGSEQWAKFFGRVGFYNDTPSDIAVDSLGYVIVTGKAAGNYALNYVTVKYTPAGLLKWQKTFGGPLDSEPWKDPPSKVVVDANNNIYVTGNLYGANYQDIGVAAYSPGGTALWTMQYANEVARNTDAPYAIALDGRGGLIVTGTSFGSSTCWDAFTIRLAPAMVKGLSFYPLPHTGGMPIDGLVELNGVAPIGGVQVSLSSANLSLATVPSSVVVPGGSAIGRFPIKTVPVASTKSVRIAAKYNVTYSPATLNIVPPTLLSFSLNPKTVVGGNPSTGTIILTGPAPAGGVVVALASSRSAVTVPASVTIPAGARSVTFTVQTAQVPEILTAKIRATLKTVIHTAYLKVTP